MESTLALNAIWCSVGSYIYGSIYIHHHYVVTKIADHIEKGRGHDRILVAIMPVVSNCTERWCDICSSDNSEKTTKTFSFVLTIISNSKKSGRFFQILWPSQKLLEFRYCKIALIQSHVSSSPSVKIQIIGGKVYSR